MKNAFQKKGILLAVVIFTITVISLGIYANRISDDTPTIKRPPREVTSSKPILKEVEVPDIIRAPRPHGTITEHMLEEYKGLHKLYTPEQLAFSSPHLLDQIEESLDFYAEDWMFGLAKLEMAMKNLDMGSINKVLEIFAVTLPPGVEDHAKAYRILFRAWGAQQGSEAIDYAMNHFPENMVRLDAGSEAMKSWAKISGLDAAEKVASLPDAYGKDYLVYALPYVTMESEPLETMKWASKLSADYQKNALLHSMIKWINDDPAKAVDYASELAQIPDGVNEYNSVIITEAAIHLVSKDVGSALKWAQALPDGVAKKESMIAIVEWWTGQNPEQASEWLLKHGTGPENDPVVQRFSEVAAWIDPEGAAAWASTITEDHSRITTLRKVLETWSSLDAQQAKAWAQQNGVNDLL